MSHNFGTGTRGFASCDDLGTAVCVLPGTELAFAENIKVYPGYMRPDADGETGHATAIFRQIDKERPLCHHDCLELPDGKQVLLTSLQEGQSATVLQLPAAPKTEAEAEEQRRVEAVG